MKFKTGMAIANVDGPAETQFSFLAGGGEMGALMRSKDWSKTAIGEPGAWSPVLKTTLGILLNSRFPMFLFWGPELYCFYNDAYRPSLGKDGKHPAILGNRGEDYWKEIWPQIKPLIDEVMNKGQASWSEDQLLPIYRNGQMEDVYWTFSYSPVLNEEGKPVAVFVTCTETTEKVVSRRRLEESRTQLEFAIEAAELGTWDYNPLTGKIVANSRLKEWFGINETEEFTLDTALEMIVEKDRQRVVTAIQAALDPASGGYYNEEYTIQPPGSQRQVVVQVKGKAWFNSQRQAYRFNGTMQDVTSQAQTRMKLQASEQSFRNTIRQAPVAMAIFIGDNFIAETANDTYLQIVGRQQEEFIGRPLFESLPEVQVSVEQLMRSVVATGEPYRGYEFPVMLTRFGKSEVTYFNFVYQPFRNEDGEITGVFVVASDVTESVHAKHSLAESEKEFRNVVMQSPIAMTILRGNDCVIEMANTIMFEQIWGRTEAEVIGKKLLDVFPELKEQKYPELLEKVFSTGQTHSEKEAVAFVKRDEGMKKFFLDFEYAPLYESGGTVSGIMITVNDVTDRVEARMAVEASEREFRQLADSLPEMVWTTDRAGKQVFASSRWKEFTGQDPYDETSFEKIIHPADKDALLKTWAECLASGAIYRGQARLKNKEGRYEWFYVHGEPLRDEQGTIEKWIGAFTNFNEQKEIEKKLVDALLLVEKSEEQFRTLADNITQFAWMADSKGYINWYNSRWYEYTGTTFEEMEGWGWQKVHHPDHVERVTSRIQYSWDTGEDWEDTFPLRSKTGEYNWFLSRAKAIRNAAGEITHWFGTNTDITLQKQAEEKIRESEERFRNVANSAPVFIWMAGIDSMRYFYNTAWLNYTGRTLEQDQGEGWKEGVHPDDLDKYVSAYETAFANKEDFYLEYRLRRHDGEYRWTSARGVPRFTADNVFEGFIGACMDIHERIMSQKKLKEDEERLNIVIKASELGTWELNLKKMEVTYSDRYGEIFGYPPGTVLTHKELLAHIHPDDLQARREAFETAVATGFLQYESRIIWNDHSVHWVENKGKLFYDEHNEPKNIVGTTRDITAEKTYQQLLEQREQKFRLLADSMPQFIWTSDAEGNINYCNQSLYDYSGLGKEQMESGGWLQIVHPDDRDASLKAWMVSIHTGTDFIFEHRFGNAEGLYRWQLSRAIPQLDEFGGTQMWVGTSTDIQDIKEQEQQKDFFISMASHELKTPITSIKGYVQILQSTYDKSDDKFLKNSLRVIDKQVINLTSLIADLLDVSKIKTGSLVLNREDFELNQLLQDTIDEISHVFPDYHISFIHESPLPVNADKGRIGQVLINFLTNAIKYSPDAKTVTVKSMLQHDYATVTVQDSGIGISKADQQKIFDRFYRVEGKNENTFPGFGIGLFIAAEIVRKHFGKIGVDSEPGKGSVFYFSIPPGTKNLNRFNGCRSHSYPGD